MQQPLEYKQQSASITLNGMEPDVKPSPEKPDEYTWDVKKLEQILLEIKNQPKFRLACDRDFDYYDGKQIDQDELARIEELGLAPIVDNLIMPTVNAVLGMQAKSRVDTKVNPEAGETNTDIALALSMKLKQFGAMARSDRAKSDAYAEMIKGGVSWVEVARNSDPFKPVLRYDHINRHEMAWDWHAKKADLSDARYVVRSTWVDEDVLCYAFPEAKDFIRQAFSTRANWDMQLQGAALMASGQEEMGFSPSIEQYEWMNSERRRLKVYEVWYKVHVKGHVAKLPNGRVIEWDENDPQHQQQFYDGQVKPRQAAFDKVRVAFWIGSHRVSDEPSPYKHRHFPYVPFFGFREDRTRIPYGLIRSMISQQDEINARKRKMLWLLSAKRVIATEKAVQDHSVAADEVARADAYIIVSNHPNERFEVQENSGLAAQQFQVMQEAKASIQANVGVHNTAMGRTDGATSGIAINSLIEQDSITLAELNDNFNMSCRHADELFLSLIIEELSDEVNESVLVEDDSDGNEREIVLNEQVIDEQTGQRLINNDVTKVNVSVVLADTPSTPTFRNQQLNQMSEMVKALPPQAQGAMLPYMIEMTDLPKRKAIAKIIRQQMGMGEGQEDPMVQQLQQQVQELTAKLEAKHPQELLAAQVEKINAEIELIKSKSVESSVKAVYESVQAGGAIALNSGIVPIADSVMKSAGFVDKDQPGITNGQVMPPEMAQQPDPAQAEMPPEAIQEMPEAQPMESPGEGIAQGIETPQADMNPQAWR